MARKFCFEKIWDYDKKTRVFMSSNREILCVDSFKDGIAVINSACFCGDTITPVTEILADCFDENSNFVSELLKAFGCDDNTVFTGIRVEINGVNLLVTKDNADADKIYKEFKTGYEANEENWRLKMEAYMKTPEYRAKRIKALKAKVRKQHVMEEVISIDNSTELEFKDDEGKFNWEKYVEINSKDEDNYGIVKYAQRCAKYMQHLMKKHNKNLAEIARNAISVCDIEGMSEATQNRALFILVQCWKYGDELLYWYYSNT